jgi:hypothetical protein
MSRPGRSGGEVALLSSDGRYAYLSGTQYYRTWMDSAPRPFIDRVEIRTGAKQRLFESGADMYEHVVAPLDDDFRRAVVVRESPSTVPDSYLRDMTTGALTQLTHNRDYAPEVTQAIRKRIQVTRADGYRFWVDLTLPRDYKPGTRLPAFFWFYPYEYTDQASYDRTKRTLNRNQFHTPSVNNKEILVTQGYAVVQPDVPIVGEAGRMNDNYVNDLRNSLSAAIDELDRQGYIDRSRLGVGGHSYGAFSTVNAMVHTPFFRAGIAGAERLPERASRPVDRAEHVPRDVALPLRQSPLGRAPHVPRHRGPERRDGSHELDPPAARARRDGEDRRAVHVPVRGSRPGHARDDPGSVGALHGVARRVRQESKHHERQRQHHCCGREVIARGRPARGC